MESNDAAIRALEFLSDHLRIGLVIVDASCRPSWMSARASHWIARESEASGVTRFADAVACGFTRAVREEAPVATCTVEGFAEILIVTRYANLDSTGSALLCIEGRECAERSATHVRSTARCGDFERLVRSFLHDIKTPLNAMNLQLALLDRTLTMPSLLGESGASDRRRSSVDVMKREVKRVDELAAEFANTWRSAEPEPTTADLRSTVSAVIDELQPVFRLAGARCEFNAPDSPVHMVLRHDLIRHGLVNLLLGALDHDPHGLISVGITVTDELVRVIVPRALARDVSIPQRAGATGPRAHDELRRSIALQDLEVAGGRLLMTDRDERSWFEIEFTRNGTTRTANRNAHGD